MNLFWRIAMLNYFWPVILIVVSNVVYHVTAKSTPGNASPFLSLTITYLIGAVCAFLLYLFTVADNSLVDNVKTLNWTSYALGFAIVGLEAGYIFLYRKGWNISTGSLVANILLAVVLIGIGIVFYKERIDTKQLVGIGLCVTGLVLVCK